MISSHGTDIKNFIFRVLVPLAGCVAATMATIYIMQEVNPLAAVCVCASAVFFLIAVVAPKVGVTLLILQCAYSDLLKRMLMFWGEMTFEQVGYVLSGAPIVVAGLSVALGTRWAFHRVPIKLRDVLMVIGVGLAIVISFVLSKRAGEETIGAFKNAANSGLYLLLAPIMIRVVESRQDVDKILMRARFIFVPVALYGIWQSIFGLADFEIAYLKSGLTIMIKELYDLRPRPFSTLNSAGSLGTVCAAFAVLSLYPLLVRRVKEVTLKQTAVSIGCAVLFLVATLASLVRSAIVVWIVAMIAYWCFRSAARTRIFYSGAVVSFIILVASSGYILQNIADWDPAQYVTSDVASQALRIQTYSERLKGFENLTRTTDMYSLFGLPEERKMTDTTYNHDPISSLLVNVGLVGLLAAVIPMIIALRFVHRRMLALPEGPERNAVVLLVAIDAGWLACHVLFNGVVNVFPVNAFFWMFGGLAGALLLELHKPETNQPPLPTQEETPRWAQAPESRPAWAGVR